MTTMQVDKAMVTPLDEDGQPSGPAREIPGIKTVIVNASQEDAERRFQEARQDVLNRLRTVSLIEAGALFGIGRTKTYELNRAGEFPVRVRNIAGQLRVRVADIEEFYANT